MISAQKVYIESKENKPNETKGNIESSRAEVIFIRRNIKPPTVLEMRFARLRKVMLKRSSSII